MLGDKSPYIILGEASESDEETAVENLLGANENIPAQARSDSESSNECNIAKEAFHERAEEAGYNSLLHLKLRESNFKLKENLNQLVTDSTKNTIDQVSNINQKLIGNQIDIQGTLKHLRKSKKAVIKLESIMTYLLEQNFVPSINIEI